VLNTQVTGFLLPSSTNYYSDLCLYESWDKYLNYESHHPLAHKLSVIRTLFSRADSICSSLVERSTEEQHITQALRRNGYPHSLISKYSRPKTPSLPTSTSKPKAIVVLPYIRNVSEAIQRILSQLELVVRFRPHRTLHNLLSHPKDPIPEMDRTGVVYRIPCASCEKCYIGQTGRSFSHRQKEHKAAVKSFNVTSSALAQHYIDTGHTIDWDNAAIIDSHPHWHHRCSLESWHIRAHPDSINRDFGTLRQAYNCLIQSSSRSNI